MSEPDGQKGCYRGDNSNGIDHTGFILIESMNFGSINFHQVIELIQVHIKILPGLPIQKPTFR
jgi:hypothetical protein